MNFSRTFVAFVLLSIEIGGARANFFAKRSPPQGELHSPLPSDFRLEFILRPLCSLWLNFRFPLLFSSLRRQQRLHKTALIQLTHQAIIDELLWLGGLGFRCGSF